MPWSGTGTYTRGYASWTADATNGLPISATKFDTEDNDFAAGIQNCLTIDGQNKPNATLTWAQALTLTKGSDSTVFSVARTGGTNNPSMTWVLADSADSVTVTLNTGNAALTFTPAAYTFGNAGDNPSYTFKGTGTFNVGGSTSLKTDPGSFNIANTSPTYSLTSTGATTNQKLWDFVADSGGIFHSRLVNDTNSGATDWLAVTRTGFASANVAFPNSIVQISDNAPSPTLFPAGYMALPPNNQSVSYTALLSDQSKQLVSQGGGAKTFTIPSNASVPYPQGTILHFVNPPGSSSLTIAITTDTLTFSPSGATGSRTVTAPGVGTAEKIGATSWLFYGINVS
jgi:hypothetical protein